MKRTYRFSQRRVKQDRGFRFVVAITSFAVLFSLSAQVTADIFGSFEIEFVTIGNPGNVAYTNGRPDSAGSVNYVYRIGKFEISRDMVTKVNAEGGLGIMLSDIVLILFPSRLVLEQCRMITPNRLRFRVDVLIDDRQALETRGRQQYLLTKKNNESTLLKTPTSSARATDTWSQLRVGDVGVL